MYGLNTVIHAKRIAPTLVNPTKISLPSGVALQQFFTGHDFNVQNTTVPNWTDFIQTLTSFNLKLELSDFLTGQLAEDQITNYDSSGRSNRWYYPQLQFTSNCER